MKSLTLFFVLLSLFGLQPRTAQAMSFGDAALTVGVSSGVGAILGASTLPFYSNSGDHTKNIFYGAALGAVAGVFLASMAAVQDGSPEAKLDIPMDKTILAQSSARMDRNSAPEVWSPVAQLRF